MRAELVLNSSDFEILNFDDLYLTFHDTDTDTKVQIVMPEHIANKFKEELNNKL